MLHVFGSKIFIFILALALVALRIGYGNAIPQCTENPIHKEEIICTNVADTKELSAVLKSSCLRLKIVNEKVSEFVWNGGGYFEELKQFFLNMK